jgi:hypothetical protein
MLKVGNLKNKTAADKIAVIDKATGNPVAYDLKYVDIHDIRWNRDQGYLHLVFRLGYMDSGKFVAAQGYEAVTFSIDRSMNPELWAKYELDTMNYFDRLELILHQESGVSRAAIVNWKLDGVGSVAE